MGYKRVDSYDNARDKVKHKIRFRLLPLHQIGKSLNILMFRLFLLTRYSEITSPLFYFSPHNKADGRK